MNKYESISDMMVSALAKKGTGFTKIYDEALFLLEAQCDPFETLMPIVNFLPNVADGSNNYWSSPQETLISGGDCEDKATLMFYLFHAISEECLIASEVTNVRMAPVLHTFYGAHMVLFYEFQGVTKVIDTSYLKDGPRPLSSISFYSKVLYTFDRDCLYSGSKVFDADSLPKWRSVQARLLKKESMLKILTRLFRCKKNEAIQ